MKSTAVERPSSVALTSSTKRDAAAAAAGPCVGSCGCWHFVDTAQRFKTRRPSLSSRSSRVNVLMISSRLQQLLNAVLLLNAFTLAALSVAGDDHQSAAAAAVFHAGCVFPVEMRGDWYESDVGRVTITASDVSTKGTCVDAEHNFYLIENREQNCFQCLVVEQRHENVVQYKQSFCVGRDTLSHICTSMHGQSIFRTLIKDPGTPTSCPFHGAYHFVYNNNSGGFCRNPVSYIRPCSPSSRLVFHFRRCSDAVYTYERDWNMECVGFWRDGAQTYLVGRLMTSSMDVGGDYFRCFMYQILGTVVHLAMSVDASCRGLRSPRDGSTVMELTQDTFGWPKARCTFPAFVTRSSWRDLAATRVYRASDMGDSIVVSRTGSGWNATAATLPTSGTRQQQQQQQQPGVVSLPWQPVTVVLCHTVVETNATAEFFIAETFVLDGCFSKFQCMKFLKKTDGVLEVREGPKTDYATGSCPSMHRQAASRRILITEAVTSRACPLAGGQYPLRVGVGGSSASCVTYLRSGCFNKTIIDVTDSCSQRPGIALECLRKWREGRQRYVITRLLGDPRGSVNCFSFRSRSDSLLFSVDDTCDVTGSRDNAPLFISFVLSPKALKCDPTSTSDVIDADSPSVGSDDVDTAEAAHRDVIEAPPQLPLVPPSDTKRSRDYRTSPQGNATASAAPAAILQHRYYFRLRLTTAAAACLIIVSVCLTAT